MLPTPTIDNSVHFHLYNGTSPSTIEHRKRQTRTATKSNKNIARRTLQATILQLLIAAQTRPVDVAAIAEHINYSTKRTLNFLVRHHDDLWTPYNGNTSLWWTSLRDLPDRLFY